MRWSINTSAWRETDDGLWAIHFSTILLATFDERDCSITG